MQDGPIRRILNGERPFQRGPLFSRLQALGSTGMAPPLARAGRYLVQMDFYYRGTEDSAQALGERLVKEAQLDPNVAQGVHMEVNMD
jgi:hypothetical protein